MERIIAIKCNGEIEGFIETDYPEDVALKKISSVFRDSSRVKRADLVWHYIAVAITVIDDPKIRAKSVDIIIKVDDKGIVDESSDV